MKRKSVLFVFFSKAADSCCVELKPKPSLEILRIFAHNNPETMSSSLSIRSDLSTGQIVQGTVASLAFVVSAHYILARRRARAKENDKPTRTGATVYGFAMANPCEGDRSPFCTKIMTFLKMTQTEYEYVPFHDHQGKGSPKGKMPWIQFPEVLGDESMGDSTMIIKALIKADPDKYDLDVHLSESEKAIGWAMKTMVEESLYFSAILYPRWATDEFFTLTLPEYFGRETWVVQRYGPKLSKF